MFVAVFEGLFSGLRGSHSCYFALTLEPMPAPIRPARASEWLRCALAHHFSPELSVRNEVVVLALGVDQYLQEVYHHLTVCSSGSAPDGELVSGEDFRLLCGCLSLEEEEVCSGLPSALTFRDFHSRLCGVFAARAGAEGLRLPVTTETEHVEREIRMRWPRVRRRRCVSFDLSQDRARTAKYGPSKETGQDLQQRTWREQVEMENASLRELVEDLRSALQSSDARCMALEVALRRERLAPSCRLGEAAERQSCEMGVKKLKSVGRESRRRTKDLLRELELIRASRDGQLQEAMRFNQRLEEELAVAYGEVSRLEEALGSMRRESAEIKKKAEEARGALAAGLKRVREIQDLAQQVTPLQEKVQNLEAELERFRSQCTCGFSCEQRPEAPVESAPRVLPTGRDETFIRGAEEGLQRAVEGRAASDEEEEEERGEEEGQCCMLEVKRLINRLHNCSKGCQKTAVCHLLLSQYSTGCYAEPCGCSGSREAKVRGRRHHMLTDEKELEKDVQMKQEEVDGLRLEAQTVQTERVRLSLLEGKHTDTLSALLQLREKRVTRRALGKILLDTLDLCSRKAQDPIPVIQVVDTLCEQLVSSELLYGEEEVTVGSAPRVTPGHRNPTNSLRISC
ncbi:EF-hand and coiled-coil domain-containing protein 1 isoform X1 [Pygocentrus nattereri]|uniref:EF-hand and coiled-coil domain-containing protein 1 isoform X1 n=1 Tax=Pygocentrus nattereri TaxID=42514 RepID=UPI001891A8F2|nr:EF-hand and coiled-coil domain-containing protein 1 isoform X1 [Pygocentrus nattereri]